MGTRERIRGVLTAPIRLLRRLYDWTLSLADRPAGEWSLFGLAFAESTFFPVPPDVLLTALALGKPRKALRLGLVCTLGSALGGLAGYWIGLQFYDAFLGEWIADSHYQGELDRVIALYREHGGWITAVAGFTPIPYKMFTIGAGICKVGWATFFAASVLSRGARFCLLAGLLRWKGEAVRTFIEEHFNRITVLGAAVLILAYLMYRILVAP